jgi:DNA polymerase-3 subunit gamma/tau
LTSSGAKKIVIIENADRMQDSARNAMLKLLEEPPSFVHIILLSTRRAAIIPTILSRTRPYSLPARAMEEEREVISKIFRRDPEGFSGLRDFFLSWREINPEKLSQLARRFMVLATSPLDARVDIVEEMSELLPERRTQRTNSTRDLLSSFLEELLRHLGELLRQERWSAAVRDAYARIESFNMQPSEVIEALYYRLLEEQTG